MEKIADYDSSPYVIFDHQIPFLSVKKKKKKKINSKKFLHLRSSFLQEKKNFVNFRIFKS